MSQGGNAIHRNLLSEHLQRLWLFRAIWGAFISTRDRTWLCDDSAFHFCHFVSGINSQR